MFPNLEDPQISTGMPVLLILWCFSFVAKVPRCLVLIKATLATSRCGSRVKTWVQRMQTATQENITKHEGKRDGDWGLETKIELSYAVGFSWICQLVVYLLSAMRQAQVLSLGTFIHIYTLKVFLGSLFAEHSPSSSHQTQDDFSKSTWILWKSMDSNSLVSCMPCCQLEHTSKH